MKTLEQTMKYDFGAFDGRDKLRLTVFIPENKLSDFEFEYTVEKGRHRHREWTRENILKQLRDDVTFGFEKALDKRGISSNCMAEVVKMWNWILEEGLEEFDEYPMYGLPIFKATAIKYNWPNPIGDDSGSEEKYNSN